MRIKSVIPDAGHMHMHMRTHVMQGTCPIAAWWQEFDRITAKGNAKDALEQVRGERDQACAASDRAQREVERRGIGQGA